MRADLLLGDWREALAGLEAADALITDPPYSSRTHDGFRSGSEGVEQRISRYGSRQPGCRNRLGYEALTEELAEATVQLAVRLEVRWFVCWGDHSSWQLWERLLEEAGFLTFAPVVWLKSDAPPRMAGDGPQCSAEYLCVGRPRAKVRSPGSRPGHYIVGTHKSPLPPARRIVGMKRQQDVAQVVRDYSDPGDLVVDPFAGTAPVGVSCVQMDRRYVGAEIDPRTHALGAKAMWAATRPLPGTAVDRWARGRHESKQINLDLEAE